MGWKKRLAVLGIGAAVLPMIGTSTPITDPRTMSRIACYVALANDLTPLLARGEPDLAASSPECAATLDQRVSALSRSR